MPQKRRGECSLVGPLDAVRMISALMISKKKKVVLEFSLFLSAKHVYEAVRC